MRSRLVRTILFSLIMISASCASPEQTKHDEDYRIPIENKALATAWKMIGRPYRYSGELPSGFDCSGLVRYSYRSAGLDLPHGTADLRDISYPIDLCDLRKGDLLFFENNGRKYAHVGIYAGNDRFVHAASTSNAVRIDSLQDPYWKERLLDARRL